MESVSTRQPTNSRSDDAIVPSASFSNTLLRPLQMKRVAVAVRLMRVVYPCVEEFQSLECHPLLQFKRSTPNPESWNHPEMDYCYRTSSQTIGSKFPTDTSNVPSTHPLKKVASYQEFPTLNTIWGSGRIKLITRNPQQVYLPLSSASFANEELQYLREIAYNLHKVAL